MFKTNLQQKLCYHVDVVISVSYPIPSVAYQIPSVSYPWSQVPQIQQSVLCRVLMLLIYEFGKPRPNGFPKICPQAQISKTLTPGDIENEVATPKIW